MTRTLSTARMPATPPLVVALAMLAFGAAPSVAVADGGIPLDTAISEQYQAAQDVVEAAVEAPATPVAPPNPAPVEAAPPGAPEPATEEPRYQPEEAPQYQVNDASSNSDLVSQATPQPAPAEPAEQPPAEQPPEDRRAHAREEPPEPPAEKPARERAIENVAAMVGALTEVAEAPEAPAAVPAVELPSTEQPTVGQPSVEIPADSPEPPPAPVAPAGNLNVSIRIFSPGADGPVTQVLGDGGAGPPTSVAAPTTWKWNWTWIGAPGCDPSALGRVVPVLGVAGWTWDWNWTCDPGGSMSPVGTLPIVVGIPDVDDLVDLDSLPGIDVPDTEISTGGEPAKPAADAPESRAGRARSGGTSPLPSRGGSAVWAQPPPSGEIAVLSAGAAAKPAVNRTAKRPSGRDTTRVRPLVPAHSIPMAPSAAVASAAGAAGGGAAPAILAPLTILFLSLLAGALIAGVGLPRLKRRAARLERPG